MATATHSADFKASYHPPETSKDNFRHTFAIRVTISDRNPRAMYEYFEKMGFKGAQVYMPATKRDHVAIVRFFTQNDAEKAIESCKDRYKASLDMFDPELLLKVAEPMELDEKPEKRKGKEVASSSMSGKSEAEEAPYVSPHLRKVAEPMELDEKPEKRKEKEVASSSMSEKSEAEEAPYVSPHLRKYSSVSDKSEGQGGSYVPPNRRTIVSIHPCQTRVKEK